MSNVSSGCPRVVRLASAYCLGEKFMSSLQRWGFLIGMHGHGGFRVCVALFLLNRYWGIVTVPGSFLKPGDLG